jgi:hypothetical protein
MAPRSPLTPRLNVEQLSTPSKIRYLVNKEVYKQLKPFKTRIEELEKDIKELENATRKLSRRMNYASI